MEMTTVRPYGGLFGFTLPSCPWLAVCATWILGYDRCTAGPKVGDTGKRSLNRRFSNLRMSGGAARNSDRIITDGGNNRSGGLMRGETAPAVTKPCIS